MSSTFPCPGIQRSSKPASAPQDGARQCEYKSSTKNSLMPTKGHKKSVHDNVKDNHSDHLREHLREVHAKIKEYACDQCDYRSEEDEQNIRSSA